MLFYLFSICPTQAQHIDSLRIMFWNVENLFDCKHDSLKQDQEFLPEALRHWHYGRYKKKLADVARTIAAVGEWKPPLLVGLCEVENDSVLRDLTRYSPLKKYGYRYVMTNSPDNRGLTLPVISAGAFQINQSQKHTHSMSPCQRTTNKRHPSCDRSYLEPRHITCIRCTHPFKVGRTKGFRTKAITSSSNHQRCNR